MMIFFSSWKLCEKKYPKLNSNPPASLFISKFVTRDGNIRRWNDWTFVKENGMWKDINLYTSMLDWVLINVLVCFYPSCRLYQVRCSLKVSPGKLPIQIETCIPDQNANSQTTGPCIINGAGVSKVFQILYRNEEVSLRDVIMFRAHLLGKFMVETVIKRREIVRSLVGKVSIF
jgi:hypothetical protein